MNGRQDGAKQPWRSEWLFGGCVFWLWTVNRGDDLLNARGHISSHYPSHFCDNRDFSGKCIYSYVQEDNWDIWDKRWKRLGKEIRNGGRFVPGERLGKTIDSGHFAVPGAGSRKTFGELKRINSERELVILSNCMTNLSPNNCRENHELVCHFLAIFVDTYISISWQIVVDWLQ